MRAGRGRRARRRPAPRRRGDRASTGRARDGAHRRRRADRRTTAWCWPPAAAGAAAAPRLDPRRTCPTGGPRSAPSTTAGGSSPRPARRAHARWCSAAGCSASRPPAGWPAAGSPSPWCTAAEHLMERQLDPAAGAVLAGTLAGLGVARPAGGAGDRRGRRRRRRPASTWPTAGRSTPTCWCSPAAYARTPRSPRPPGLAVAAASWWTTGCAPATRRSRRSATAPSTTDRATAWSRPPGSRPAWSPTCSPAADPLARYRRSPAGDPAQGRRASTWPRWATRPATDRGEELTLRRPGPGHLRASCVIQRRAAGRRDPARRQPGGRHGHPALRPGAAGAGATAAALLLGRALGAVAATPGRLPGADAGRGDGLPVQHGEQGRTGQRCWRSGARTVDAVVGRDPGHHRMRRLPGRGERASSAGCAERGIGGGDAMSGGELVVVGNGMVGQRFVEALRARDTDGPLAGHGARPRSPARRTTGCGSRPTSTGSAPSELNLHTARTTGCGCGSASRPPRSTGTAQVVTTAVGEYRVRRAGAGDRVVRRSCRRCRARTCPASSSTGPSTTSTAIRAYAPGRRVGAVIGGGLLGLEAANALRLLGLEHRTWSSSRPG